jgi:hypothetical protein
MKGQHWVALFVELNEFEFFSSYGDDIDSLF